MPRKHSGSPSPRPAGGGSAKNNSSSNGNRSVFSKGSHSRNVPVVQSKPATAATPATAPAPAGRSTSDVMKDMAATAAGVAVGSAVGHAVGASITGALSEGGSSNAAATAEQPAAERRPRSEMDGPCSFEISQFLKCSEENSDLNVCHDFNEAMKRCRQHYNL